MNTEQSRLFAEFLETLERNKFFGEVRLKFEAGTIVHAKKEETLKAKDLQKQ